jgi:hypothetical protein
MSAPRIRRKGPKQPPLPVVRGAVFVAVATYDGTVDVRLTAALLHEFHLLQQAGWVTAFDALEGCCYVEVARNKLADRFLRDHWTDPRGAQKPFSDLVFVDADVHFAPGALLRLLSHDVDVVFGATPLKHDREGYPCELVRDERGGASSDPATGLIEAAYGPAGFLRIRRGALAELAASTRVPEVIERTLAGQEIGKYRAFFQTEYAGTRFVGEDVLFFERWRAHKGRAWLDPEIPLFHRGSKTWAGHAGNYLRAREAEARMERQAQERLAGPPQAAPPQAAQPQAAD